MAIDRKPRSEDVRTKSTRPQTWKPPSSLDAPPAPEGFKHRWIRMESAGYDDRKNLTARLREGFDLVRAEEYPDWDLPTIQDGKHAGVIAIGGLVLARIPLDLVRQRDNYYRNQTQQQMDAVDNDLLRDQHPSMPMVKPERQSRVTFGGNRSSG
jgi:hypothetical protein